MSLKRAKLLYFIYNKLTLKKPRLIPFVQNSWSKKFPHDLLTLFFRITGPFKQANTKNPRDLVILCRLRSLSWYTVYYFKKERMHMDRNVLILWHTLQLCTSFSVKFAALLTAAKNEFSITHAFTSLGNLSPRSHVITTFLEQCHMVT